MTVTDHRPIRAALRPQRPGFARWVIRLVVVGLIGGLAYLGWREWDARRERPLPPGYIAVPVANAAIPPYTRVRPQHLTFRAVPESGVPGPTIRSASEILGRVTLTPMPAGAPFQESNFAPPGTQAGIAAGIPPGKVATTIDVSKVEGAVGLLELGNRVDVISTRKVPVRGASAAGGALTPYESQVIAREAVVISAIRQRQVPGPGSLTSGPRLQTVHELTVAVTPEEALAIHEELEVGKVRFLIRSGRAPVAGDPGATGERPRPGEAPAAREPIRPIEVITGDRIQSEVPPR